MRDSQVPNRNYSQAQLKTKQEPAIIFDKSHQINATGVFFNSKYKNSKCRYFGKQERCFFGKQNQVPGPGSYRQMSEFGFYESSKLTKN